MHCHTSQSTQCSKCTFNSQVLHCVDRNETLRGFHPPPLPVSSPIRIPQTLLITHLTPVSLYQQTTNRISISPSLLNTQPRPQTLLACYLLLHWIGKTKQVPSSSSEMNREIPFEVENMEWNFDRNNLLASKYQQGSENFLSPDYLVQQDATMSLIPGSPNLCRSKKSSTEKISFDNKRMVYEVDRKSSFQVDAYGLNSWGEFPRFVSDDGNPEPSQQRTGSLANQWQAGIGGVNQMDGIFLSSLEEDPPDMECPYRSISRFLESDCSSRIEFNNFLTDWRSISQSNSADPSGISDSSYLEGNDFRRSELRENLEDNSPSIMPESMATKAPKLKIMAPGDQNTSHGVECVHDEKSLGAMVLQDLEVVTKQMTEKTRIFFRDSLYRLAKCSKEHVSSFKQIDEDITMEESSLSPGCYKTWRSERMTAAESGTNAIDRSIANLLFNSEAAIKQIFPQ